jgi:hypothetical protein
VGPCRPQQRRALGRARGVDPPRARLVDGHR